MGFHGTLTNGPTWKTDPFGAPAIQYDGSNDYTNISSIISKTTTNTGFVSCWFNLLGISGNGVNTLVSFTNDGANTTTASSVGIGIRNNSTPGNALRLDYTFVANEFAIVDGVHGNTTLSLNHWYHVLIKSNGSNISIYLNGLPESLTAWVGTNSGRWWDDMIGIRTYSRIGNGFYAGGEFANVNGFISNVIVGRHNITDAQVYNLYKNPYSLVWKPSTKKTFVIDTPPLEPAILVHRARKHSNLSIQRPTYPYQINKSYAKELGVVAWWPGHPHGGNSIIDLSGKQRNGGFSPTGSSSSPNGVFKFDGNSGGIGFGSFFPIPTTGSLTVRWKPMEDVSSASIKHPIFRAYRVTPTVGLFDLYFYTGTITAGWWLNGVDRRVQWAATGLTVGTWYDLALTWTNSGTTTFYIDGVIKGTTSNLNTTWDTSTNIIGFAFGFDVSEVPNQYAAMEMECPTFYNTCLSPAVVQKLNQNPYMLVWKPSSHKTFSIESDGQFRQLEGSINLSCTASVTSDPTIPTNAFIISSKIRKQTKNLVQAPTYPYQINKDYAKELGIIGLWNGAPNSNRLFDISKSQNHLTFSNAPAQIVDHHGFHCLNLNGTNNATGGQLYTGTSFTTSAFIKPTSFSNGVVVFSNGFDNGVAGSGWAWGINLNEASSAELQMVHAGVAFRPSGYSFPTPNVWYHVVITYNGSTLTFYVNGNQVGTNTTVIAPLSGDIRIGSHTGVRYFVGAISQPLLSQFALSPVQVKKLYQNPYELYWKPASRRMYQMQPTTGAVQNAATALTATGSLTGNVVIVKFAATTLTAIGTISPNADLITITSTSMTAVGTLEGNSTKTLFADVSLTADGDIATNAISEQLASTSLTADGDITTDADAIMSAATSLSSNGDVTASATNEQLITVSLTADGDLAANAGIINFAATNLTSDGDLAADGTKTLLAVASITADGDLVSTPITEALASVDLAANGDISAEATYVQYVATSLTADGDIETAATSEQLISVSLTADGDIASAGEVSIIADVTLTATVTLEASTSGEQNAEAHLTAEGDLVANADAILYTSTALTASGTLTAHEITNQNIYTNLTADGDITTTASKVQYIATTLTAVGTLNPSAISDQLIASSLTAYGDITAAADSDQLATTSLTADGDLDAEPSFITQAAVDLTADGDIVALGERIQLGNVNLTAVGTITAAAISDQLIYTVLTADGDITANATSNSVETSLTADGDLTASPISDQLINTSLTAVGTLSTNGTKTQYADASLTADATLNATGTKNQYIATTLTSIGSLSATGSRDQLIDTTLTSAGDIAANPTSQFITSTNLTASGDLSSVGTRIRYGSTSLTGECTISSEAIRTQLVTTSLNATATLTGNVISDQKASAALIADGDISANAVRVQYAATSMTASGIINPTARGNLTTATTLTAIGTLDSSAIRTQRAAIAYTATATVSPRASKVQYISTTLTAYGDIVAHVNTNYAISTSLTSVVTLVANGKRTSAAATTLTATGTLSPSGLRTQHAATALTAAATLSSSGLRNRSANVALNATGIITSIARCVFRGVTSFTATAIVGATASESQYILPSPIGSDEQFGTPEISRGKSIEPTSILSEEHFGVIFFDRCFFVSSFEICPRFSERCRHKAAIVPAITALDERFYKQFKNKNRRKGMYVCESNLPNEERWTINIREPWVQRSMVTLSSAQTEPDTNSIMSAEYFGQAQLTGGMGSDIQTTSIVSMETFGSTKISKNLPKGKTIKGGYKLSTTSKLETRQPKKDRSKRIR